MLKMYNPKIVLDTHIQEIGEIFGQDKRGGERFNNEH